MPDQPLIIHSGSYHIRQLLESEFAYYKSIRLEAIHTEPTLFRWSDPAEASFSDMDWQERIKSPRIVFGLFEKDNLIGMTSLLLLNNTEAYFGQSFIRPKHRGQGLSKLLYRIRMTWVSLHQLKQLSISHREINTISKTAIQRAGFKYSHRELVQWLDGTSGYSMYYSLTL
ncbi:MULTISPECIES: GNAT family N-acetyltransferase [unclassified Sphingobacterium]|uniref:GNAT family N-acetyltransferase n=1 Tax=unclassified Sphingobacterium TaxID=2609468 RepID=UPI0025DBB9DD|nr:MULTISPECIES: GNAT family N-acetyltransferase [unclassified Sphingobacterium]